MPDELERIFKLSRKVEFQPGSKIFHQVKRFDKDGKLIEVIPAEKLENQHWQKFRDMEKKVKYITIKNKKGRKKDVSAREIQKPSSTKQLKTKKL